MELMRHVTLGQYVERTSPVHRLDPRVKLLGLVWVMALTFRMVSGPGFALLAVGLVLLAAVSQIGLVWYLGGLRSVVWLALLTAVFNLFFTSEGHPLWRWHVLVVTDVGLHGTGLILARILTLVMATSLLTLTTAPLALTDGLERLGTPLSRLGLMVSIALRFIPTLMEQAERLMKAQMARGADLESPNPVRRVQALVPILVPLFVAAFRAADDLADAMESRGYRGGPRARAFRQLQWKLGDTLAGLMLSGVSVGLLALDGIMR
jgi:energy-coupling factor transport system permease protein